MHDDTHAKSKESLTFCQFLFYLSFFERFYYSRKSKLKLVREEYPYADFLISTFLVLGAFDSELPFSDSLGRKRNQSGARRAVTGIAASVFAEVEHACTRTTAIEATTPEPSTVEKREVRVI